MDLNNRKVKNHHPPPAPKYGNNIYNSISNQKYKFCVPKPNILFTVHKSNIVFIPWVVALARRLPSMRKVAGSIPGRCTDLYCATFLRGNCSVMGWSNRRSIGSTFSDSIVRRWLWSTASRICPFHLGVTRADAVIYCNCRAIAVPQPCMSMNTSMFTRVHPPVNLGGLS